MEDTFEPGDKLWNLLTEEGTKADLARDALKAASRDLLLGALVVGYTTQADDLSKSELRESYMHMMVGGAKALRDYTEEEARAELWDMTFAIEEGPWKPIA